MHTRPTFYDKMYQLLTKEIIIRNRVIFITSKSDPKSAYKVDESKQRPQNEFYLSPPSECVEHHLLVEISTKDSCLSESQFFFCLFFWSLRLTALRLDPDMCVRFNFIRSLENMSQTGVGWPNVVGIRVESCSDENV